MLSLAQTNKISITQPNDFKNIEATPAAADAAVTSQLLVENVVQVMSNTEARLLNVSRSASRAIQDAYTRCCHLHASPKPVPPRRKSCDSAIWSCGGSLVRISAYAKAERHEDIRPSLLVAILLVQSPKQSRWHPFGPMLFRCSICRRRPEPSACILVCTNHTCSQMLILMC